ncbi:MAG: tol-pal system YbgF family protein [Candidatus Methylacidiphilales bacterium]
MDTNTCIDNNIWEAYANNTISEANLIYMENHVKTCELCADMKEGIDAMLVPSLLVDRVNKVNKSVDEIVKQKNNKKYLLTYWSAAAVLLIAVGLFWFNYTNLAPQLAQNESTLKSPSVLNETDSIYNYVPPKTNAKKEELALNKEQKQTIIKSVPAEVLTEKSVEAEKADMDDVSAIEIGQKNAGIAESDMAIPEVKMEVQTETVTAKDKAPAIAKTESKKKVEITSKAAKALSLPAPANNNNVGYNNYSLNNNWMDTVLLNDKFRNENYSDSLNYKNAQNEYIANRLDNSLDILDLITNNNKSKYYEDALFLSAQVYVKQNNKGKAKSALKKVIKLKGNKQAEAEQLLKSVK